MILKQIKLILLFVFGLVFLAQAQQTIPATRDVGLSDENFWCSNQYSQYTVWKYYMSDNTPSPASKKSNYTVRAIRSF